MKYLIVGLGNIGPEYAATRHNIGFMVLDELAGAATFAPARFGVLHTMKHRGRSYLLLKPDTYMNLSGKAVAHYVRAEKLALENILIITDDLALPFGTVRLRGQGSDGGHNGLKSINAELNATNYPRMRVGIGSNFAKGRQVDYVLAPFVEEERAQLDAVLKHCAAAVKDFGFLPFEQMASRYNKVVATL